MIDPRKVVGRVAGVALLALAFAACGSNPTDTEVLGERIARDESAVDDGAARPSTEAAASTAPPTDSGSGSGAGGSANDASAPAALDAPAEAPHTPPVTPPATAGPDVLSLEFQLESASVAPGGDVRGTLVAHNPTDQIVDITHPDQCETVHGLYQGETKVSEGMACAIAIRSDQVGPGETRTWTVRIPAGSLAPGAYEARAGLHLAGGADRYAPAVPVTLSAA